MSQQIQPLRSADRRTLPRRSVLSAAVLSLLPLAVLSCSAEIDLPEVDRSELEAIRADADEELAGKKQKRGGMTIEQAMQAISEGK